MTADLSDQIEDRLREALAEVGASVREDDSASDWSTGDERHPIRTTRALLVACAAVALIIGVAVALSLARSTTDSRHDTSSSSPTIRSRAPTIGFLSVPNGRNSRTVDVWTWNGRRAGSFTTAGTACCNTVHLSPDGTRVLVDGNVDTATQVLDRQGHVLARTPALGNVWADDSRHLCAMQPHNPLPRSPLAYTDDPADLVVVLPGDSRRVYRTTLTYGEHSGPDILRCSVTHGVALIGESSFGGIVHVVAIDLGTGRISTPRWARGGVGTQLVAVSGRGHYAISEAPAGGVVADTRTGAIVSHLDGQPEAISWDGRLVVQATVATGDLEVVDWRAHRVVWRSGHRKPGSGGTFTEAEVVARPDSDDLALTVNGGLPGLPDTEAALWLLTPTRAPVHLATVPQ